VLRRARDGEAGLFPKLATVAARWRLRSSTGRRGKGRSAPARREVGLAGCGGTACGGGAAGGGLPAFLSGGGATLRQGQRKQRGREEEDDSWTCLQFQKSLGVLL